MPAVKSVAGATAAVALSLTLVSCGSDAETTGGGLSTAATAPGEATVADAARDAATSPAAEPAAPGDNGDADAPKDGEKPADNAAAPAPNAQGDQAIPTIMNPLEEGFEVPTYEPVAGGREGTAAERREIEEVVRKVTNPESFAKWTRVILDNSCASVREPALEEFEKQGLTLDMVEQIMAAQEEQGSAIEMPQTEVSVADVRIDGDRASATVTSNVAGNTSENVQLFAKEDGRWKVCNS